MRRIWESLLWQQGQLQRTPPPVEIAESSRDDVEKLPRLGMHRVSAVPGGILSSITVISSFLLRYHP
jgi:hypothetical protein